jgi:hypothetical protein
LGKVSKITCIPSTTPTPIHYHGDGSNQIIHVSDATAATAAVAIAQAA